MSPKEKVRNVLFILLGVLVLLLKQNYNGPYSEIVNNYSANISVSLAVYFLISFYAEIWKKNKLITAIISLIIVQLFEITNGYGVMKNVYDKIDLFANLMGVILAVVMDQLIKMKNSTYLWK